MRKNFKEYFSRKFKDKYEHRKQKEEKGEVPIEVIDARPLAREVAITNRHKEGEEEQDEFYREVEMVTGFLERFIFATASQRTTQVDLNLILKALPVRVDKYNCYRVELFNFLSLQEAQVAFSNQDQDLLFKHYDNRNKARLRKLKVKATTTKNLTEDLKILATSVLSILSKISHHGKSGGTRAARKLDKENISLTKEEVM